MPTKLRKIGTNRTLDARPDRLDLRDRMYLPHLRNLHEPREWPSDDVLADWLPAYRKAGLILDQGDEGACTGFGLAAVINFQLFISRTSKKSPTRKVSPYMLYELARLYDEWPGEDYEGSSCRGALKGWHRHGVCRESLWPKVVGDTGGPVEDPKKDRDPKRNWDLDALETTLGAYYRVDVRSVVDMQSAIRETGAIYVSADVHEGWDVASRKDVSSHADLVRIEYTPDPKEPGGHAFALVGYNDLGFVVQNSWGPSWGSSGFALLPYEDWVSYGSDAWVFSLGVSRQRTVLERAVKGVGIVRSPRHYVPAADIGEQAPARTVGIVSGGDAITRRFRGVDPEIAPLSIDDAYRHAIVLDRGFPVRNDFTARDPRAGVDAVGYTRPLQWMADKAGRKKIVIYAHGGLNSEASAITRARVLAPYLRRQDIYPIFVVWRTGACETMSDLIEDVAAKLGFGARGDLAGKGWREHLTDATDRMLESVLRPAGAALWGQMKSNAVRASEHEHGGMRMLVDALGQLTAAAKPAPEIHLVGHSAGSIVLGAMLTRMRAVGLAPASLRLFAPACTLAFARQHFVPAVVSGALPASAWTNHFLTDENERADAVGPYRKSLLYFVSRAFEEAHKTPLLGMELAHEVPAGKKIATDDQWARDAKADLMAWRLFRSGAGKPIVPAPLAQKSVTNGVTDIKATHGCFDNAVPIVAEMIDGVRGKKVPGSGVGMRLDY